MKRILAFICAIAVIPAIAVRVEGLPSLPAGSLPNSEVVTNIFWDIDFNRIENLSFSIEINASESNACFIAIGETQNESLSLEDADFEWGYDCGQWTCADISTGTVSNVLATAEERISSTLTVNKRHCNPDWNVLRITRRGIDAVSPSVTLTEEFKRFAITVR